MPLPSDSPSVLIANRGEIAIRIARAAAALGYRSVGVFSEDEKDSAHVRATAAAVGLPGTGYSAYLDAGRLIRIASEQGCKLLHPGYGFLSESAELSAACESAGIQFVGPSAESMRQLGDKAAARKLAEQVGVPVLAGTATPVSLEQATSFFSELDDGAAIMVKAVAGGGGRGTRIVKQLEELPEAYARARSEAEKFFGNPDVYVEQFLPKARHIEVQVLGDGQGGIIHLGERDCSLQRRFQKVVEICPAPYIGDELRERLCDAAVRLARAVSYRSAGTIEFLLDCSRDAAETPGSFYFMEANTRLQVEHTITEETTGVDIVQAQLQLGAGASLADLRLDTDVTPRGCSIQLRINAEALQPDGSVLPSSGTINACCFPGGPGIRVDTHVYPGYSPNPNFDSMMAKLIVTAREGEHAYPNVRRMALQALDELDLPGVETNRDLLRVLLRRPEVEAYGVNTRFLDAELASLLEEAAALTPTGLGKTAAASAVDSALDRADPLAALNYFRTAGNQVEAVSGRASDVAQGLHGISAPLQGTVVSVAVEPGQRVDRGSVIAVIESMKMEHSVSADVSGTVKTVAMSVGDIVQAQQHIVLLDADGSETEDDTAEEISYDLEHISEALAELQRRKAATLDDARPAVVDDWHGRGRMTVREIVSALFDEDSFVEYGGLALAAQSRKRSLEELMVKSPADGFVCGIGSVNAGQFGPEASRAVFCGYDNTVFAGSQGMYNHAKTDRMVELAMEQRLPLIFHAEGAGGRMGETDHSPMVGGLNLRTFEMVARASSRIPMIGSVGGRCFAGNAFILGMMDIIIATENSNIGMGGPVVLDGAGMGVYRSEEIGPAAVHSRNGVADVVVRDDREMVEKITLLVSYFQGRLSGWKCEDQRVLRQLIPKNRKQAYDTRRIIRAVADSDSVLELRAGYGAGVVTCFLRVEGRPLGVIANNSSHLGGAIDSEAGDKIARFAGLCERYGIPVLTLVDTPGMMIGPEAEKTAIARHSARVMLRLANLSVPMFSIILRKAYGGGAVAMVGGSSRVPVFCVGWPSTEFGVMNLEGMVKQKYRDELAAIENLDERVKRYEELVAEVYERGSGFNAARLFEIDDIIDPATTRQWITRGIISSDAGRPWQISRPMDAW